MKKDPVNPSIRKEYREKQQAEAIATGQIERRQMEQTFSRPYRVVYMDWWTLRIRMEVSHGCTKSFWVYLDSELPTEEIVRRLDIAFGNQKKTV